MQIPENPNKNEIKYIFLVYVTAFVISSKNDKGFKIPSKYAVIPENKITKAEIENIVSLAL